MDFVRRSKSPFGLNVGFRYAQPNLQTTYKDSVDCAMMGIVGWVKRSATQQIFPILMFNQYYR